MALISRQNLPPTHLMGSLQGAEPNKGVHSQTSRSAGPTQASCCSEALPNPRDPCLHYLPSLASGPYLSRSPIKVPQAPSPTSRKSLFHLKHSVRLLHRKHLGMSLPVRPAGCSGLLTLTHALAGEVTGNHTKLSLGQIMEAF